MPIDFIIGNEKQILIPQSSLLKRAGVQGVFRVNKKHQAIFTPVKIERQWKHYRVILSGLKVGEIIIINPSKKLHDGMRIK